MTRADPATVQDLPPLPEPDGWIGANDFDPDAGVVGFDADTLQAYARTAVEAAISKERERPIDAKAIATQLEDELNDYRTGWAGTPESIVAAVAAAIRARK
ncbi:MAG: hypothetical protein ACTS8S_23530 [Giesbergeria sp.]